MAEFQINLIRERVLPRARRKMLFLGMLLYLAASGVLLTMTAHTAARRFVVALARSDQVGRLEQQFRAGHPGQKDIVAYEQTLRQEMRGNVAAVEAVDGVLGGHVSISGILAGLMDPVPPDLYIMSCDFSSTTSLLEFSFAVPINQRTRGFQAEDLIARWKENDALRVALTEIKLLANERQEINRVPTYVWKFSGRATQGAL